MLSVFLGAQTIDSTGNIVGSNTTSYTDPSCGTYNATGTGGFFGREMRFSAIYTSRTCYNMNITMVLTR
jgi:hypothetical protein